MATYSTHGTQLVDVSFLERSPFRDKHNRLSKTDLSAEEIALAEKHGILQIIVARPFKRAGATYYEMLDTAGERAWLLAQVTQIPRVLIQTVPMTDTDAREYVRHSAGRDSPAAASNPIASARALPSPRRTKAKTFVPRSQQAINSHRRALLRMHPRVVLMIENREISEGHARAIKARGISKEAQLTLATRAVREKLTVRDVEKLVKEILGRQTSPSMAGRNPDQQRLEEKISNKLGYTAQFRKGWLQLYIGEDADAVNEFLQRIGGILED